VGEGLVVVGSRNPGGERGNGVGFFDAATGEQLLWRALPEGVRAAPLIQGGRVFVLGADGTVHIFSLGEG